jgi:hypothetical protein
MECNGAPVCTASRRGWTIVIITIIVVTITKTVMIPVGITRINMSYDYPLHDANIYAVVQICILMGEFNF